MIPQNLDTGDLLAVESHGLVAWLIQRWTHSSISHVATILNTPEGLMIARSLI